MASHPPAYRLSQGFVQIYTGPGKGKTTAAMGLALRAIGAGLRVYFVQFMKNFPYSELHILNSLSPDLVLKRYGNDAFVLKKQPPPQALLDEMHHGLEETLLVMRSQQYDVIILDEVCVSLYFKLFTTQEIIRFVQERPAQTELVLTGRYCPNELIELADLVTEMQEIKHYYRQGVLARRGIES